MRDFLDSSGRLEILLFVLLDRRYIIVHVLQAYMLSGSNEASFNGLMAFLEAR
jgi:hypothetical protein